ncbi:MAG TPA: DUF6055 domain-containing protein [Polyangiaceae bacterium]
MNNARQLFCAVALSSTSLWACSGSTDQGASRTPSGGVTWTSNGGSKGSNATNGGATSTSASLTGATPQGGAIASLQGGASAASQGGTSIDGSGGGSSSSAAATAKAGSGSNGSNTTSSKGGTGAGSGGTAAGAGVAISVGGRSMSATGGSSGTATINVTGGASSTAPGTGGIPGSCEDGSTATVWASNCAAAPPVGCTAGTWKAGGPQNDSCCSAMTLRSESTHFAVYSDEASVTAASAEAAVDHLETVWNLYFGSPMYLREPFCDSATKYKANIHVHSDWGLTGGAFGTNRMGMWIGTGGLTDHWGLAHEFMHGVQSVEGGMQCNQSNTCGWIYESHANWAAQQQLQYHTTDVHCSEMLANAPHLYLGSTRDRYCNWQFMEYLKDKYCFSAVNAIWTGKAAIDPFTAIRNGMNWTVAQLNDFIGEWAMHNVTWDYQDPEPQSTAGKNQGALYRSKYGITTDTSQTIRRLRTTKVEPLDADYATHRRFTSPFDWAPQRYGYNVVRLYPEANATAVTVTFRGVTAAPASPDWRWGLVATDSGLTTARYSPLQKGADATLTFCVKAGEALFLVVTATPSAWYDIVWDQPYNTVPRYPYAFELVGAWPEGFKSGAPDACPTGLARATNGGGCAPSGISAYVGPYATVLSGASVSGTARIEDHAIVAKGSVQGGTVGALSIIGTSNNAFAMSGGTVKTTFYPLGFFETGQGLSGGNLVGDVELRGTSFTVSTGTCSGFVDNATCVAPGSDATPKPPYVWR